MGANASHTYVEELEVGDQRQNGLQSIYLPVAAKVLPVTAPGGWVVPDGTAAVTACLTADPVAYRST